MTQIALFPGSFDPITKGHYDIVIRALNLFDKIIIAVGDNASKKCLFSIQKRLIFIEASFLKNTRVEVVSFSGLTADFCNKKEINYIIRGIRNATDFDYEKSIASINKTLNNKLETISFFTSNKYEDFSSNIVRDIYLNGGDISSFLPKGVNLDLIK